MEKIDKLGYIQIFTYMLSLLLVAFAQDVYESKEHGLAIKPPKDWKTHKGRAPTVVKFVCPENLKHEARIVLIQFSQRQAMTLADYVKKLKDYMKEIHKKHTVLSESEIKSPYRIVIHTDELEHIEVVIPRGMREFLIIQTAYPKSESAKFKSLAGRGQKNDRR